MNLKQKLITFKMNLCSILNIGKTGMRAGVLVQANGGGLKVSEFFFDGPIKVAHYN
jgi:hypothetical protein